MRPRRSGRRLAPAAGRPEYWAVPSEATIRRTLARLDAEALAGVLGAWLADREVKGPNPWQAVCGCLVVRIVSSYVVAALPFAYSAGCDRRCLAGANAGV
jgi:hypothetical protein